MRASFPLRVIAGRRLSRWVLLAAFGAGIVVTTTTGVASAQEEVEIEIAPPATRVEVVPVAPSARHFWIHGYYGWRAGAHYWVPGRYEVVRPGWTWQEARWAPVGSRWHFYPGHWYR